MKKRQERFAQPEGPARRHAGHVRDRITALGLGAPKAWRNAAEHPLSLAYEKGQLARGDARYTAKDRLDAGTEYRKICEIANGSGRDSTSMNRVEGGGAGVGLAGFSQTRVVALRRLIAIDGHLKRQDCAIVRRVCGEGWWPSDAVRAACGDHYRYAVTARFNEALDALIEAIEAAARTAREGHYRSGGVSTFGAL